MIAARSPEDQISALIAAELDAYDPDGAATRKVGQGQAMSAEWHRATLADFRSVLIEPQKLDVSFSGGVTMTCWAITKSNGDYRVVWVPGTETFSLVTETKFGPVDIGVHGDAIGCFGSI
ncbi:hypothetical protein [Shimia sp.]|uniref:hypothetical protein n=1 Tax=Shimia sp. TaxID=1954381 RepID=UPI003297721B